MPRTRSLAWSELKLGLLTIAALIIAGTLIFALGGEGGFPWQRYHLKTRFPNVATLKPGSPVRVAGIEAGSVSDIRFAGSEVEVVMEVNEAVRDRVRTDSRASIGSVSLLGEGAVDITASLTGTPIPDWGYVRPGPSSGQFADAINEATATLDEANKLLQEIRAGRGTVGRLFTDEELYNDLRSFASAADRVAQNLNRGGGTIGRLMNNPTAARDLEAALENLTAITKRINAGEGSLGRLLKDDAFAKSLASMTANFDAVAGRLTRGEGTAGRLMTDATLYTRIDSAMRRLDELIAQIGKGEGSAGRFVSDKQLYENANAAANELRALISDIRKDPRKYLNMKVSIF